MTLPDITAAPKQRRSPARLLIRVLLVLGVLWMLYVVAGPMRSGALLLQLPTFARKTTHDLPGAYAPLHKGGVDVATGLYTRDDEDLIVRGTPPIVFRRTYLARDHVSRQLGVGTTHNGEMYVIGDSQRFQRVALILPDGERIRFERTSGGSSIWNAMYQHRSTRSEWYGARLGWTGSRWVLRTPGGERLVFQGCGPGLADLCSIVERHDWDNHEIDYERDAAGRLMKIVAGDRWIGFEYDGRKRVTRARASTGQDVRYTYDPAGRLATVVESTGAVRSYTYTDADLMATISEPGHTIENFYDAGARCVRQVNHFPDQPLPYVFQFNYLISGNRIVGTEESESDGSWKRRTYDANGYFISEMFGEPGVEPLTFAYTRDPVSKAIVDISVTCADRSGLIASHSSNVGDRGEDGTKRDLVEVFCASPKRRLRQR
jgi:YD repeat-containing protein